MDENLGDKESLNARIQQLEHEKDELQKDIEQLCMQQAGPSYITFATQMYCRRTAGLEQEVENLKKKLTNSIKENSNIKEELSEAQRIKNSELAKQLEYMRGMLTNAFTDRDHAILEAEKAKENEDMMSQKMNDAEKRLQEVTVKFADTQEQLSSMKRKVAKQDQEMEIFREAFTLSFDDEPDPIINKFYKIRQQACRESWSFNIYKEASVANYVGWEIEKHLKSKITELEHKRVRLIVEGISSIREYNSQQKTYIMKLLDDEKSYIKSVVSSIQEKIEEFPKHTHSAEVTDFSTLNVSRMVDSSEALSQALQEKVSTLLLLSQQEERHLFEKNVQGALQETMDELQRTLQLATQEKVRALLELAEVKKEYQLLLEKTTEEGNLLTRPGDGKIIAHGRDGRLKNLFKRTSLKRWLGTEENPPVVTHPNLEPEASLNRGSYHNMNDARLRIEIATLKESMQNLERLTFDIRKLRVSLIQAKHARSSKSAASSTTEILDEIIREAEMVKLALSAALPLSWSGEGDVASSSDMNVDEDSNYGNPNTEKMDSVSAAGIEMVELLILAAQMMKKREKKPQHGLDSSQSYTNQLKPVVVSDINKTLALVQSNYVQ
uniref:Uncharacterized protein n=1 Tax=Chenopodium quinoa TaxID=63459 RepID=A0A803MC16_CHEQI